MDIFHETDKLISENLFMKCESPNCLMLGEKKKLSISPCIKNGVLYLPLAEVVWFAKGIRKEGGLLSLEELERLYPDLHFYFDTTGFVALSKQPISFNRTEHGQIIIDIMKRFLYDVPSEEELYDAVFNHTDGFSHPYLLANGQTFSRLRSVYLEGEKSAFYDSDLFSNIDAMIKKAESTFSELAVLDEDGGYVGLKPEKEPVNEYRDTASNGYDAAGGRINIPTGMLPLFAFAYQITQKLDYARIAYDYSLAVDRNFRHFGPGHFLNCANGMHAFSLSYDWLYEAYGELEREEPKKYLRYLVERVIWEKGVYMGYISSLGLPTIYIRNQRDASHYSERTNNWNAVCSEGMIISSLAIMQNKWYKEVCCKLITHDLFGLVSNGLDAYYPDGSYPESASYWGYGTNYLFLLIAALYSSTGEHYGLKDIPGLDRTCYFALHIESSDYVSWSYHDGSSKPMDTTCFPFASFLFNNPDFAEVRKKQIRGGKEPSLLDCLYFDRDARSNYLPALSYYMEGIDAFTARSSFDVASLFTGLMGGYNRASHGQIDSGNFIYHNNGVVWFCDIGGDNYNTYNYFGDPVYYRKTAEGNNVLCLVGHEDVPYGQQRLATGRVVSSFDCGSYAGAVIDNTEVYSPYVERALRGILLTDDRRTVVIQDEVDFIAEESCYWFGHYNKNSVTTLTLSDDGRTAIMQSTDKNGKPLYLRIAIKSPDEDLRFEIMDCYTFVLDATARPGYSEQNGGVPENSRDNYAKLAIKIEKKKKVRLKVVIEPVDLPSALDKDSEFIPMSEWK